MKRIFESPCWVIWDEGLGDGVGSGGGEWDVRVEVFARG